MDDDDHMIDDNATIPFVTRVVTMLTIDHDHDTMYHMMNYYNMLVMEYHI